MKTSDSMARECKIFTNGFIGFLAIYHIYMKLQSNTSYMAVTTSSNLENIPHTNLIHDSFEIEAKVMETSDSMARECKIFTHEFLGFRLTENLEFILQSHT